MKRADHVWQLCLFKLRDVPAAGQLRHHIEYAEPRALFHAYRSQLLQHVKQRRISGYQGHVGNQQRIFTGFQLPLQQRHIGHRADAPSFRIQDLPKRGAITCFILEDKDADLRREGITRGRHSRSIGGGGVKVTGHVGRAPNPPPVLLAGVDFDCLPPFAAGYGFGAPAGFSIKSTLDGLLWVNTGYA